jgi:hypothetical protein
VPTKLIIKHSTTASVAPTSGDLDTGELAVNTIDKRLYTEDDASNVVELGTNPSSLTLGGSPTITTGTGTPNGNLNAPRASLYLRTADNSEGYLYVKTTANTSNTGWTPIT